MLLTDAHFPFRNALFKSFTQLWISLLKTCYDSFKDFICTSTYADTQVAIKEAFNG